MGRLSFGELAGEPESRFKSEAARLRHVAPGGSDSNGSESIVEVVGLVEPRDNADSAVLIDVAPASLGEDGKESGWSCVLLGSEEVERITAREYDREEGGKQK